MLTGVALGVVQALHTGAGPSVAGPRVVHVDVVVALAGQAAPAGHQRVPEIPRSALVTPGTWRTATETGSEAPRFKVQRGLEVFVCEVKTSDALNGCLHENKSVPGECCEMLPVCVCVCIPL